MKFKILITATLYRDSVSTTVVEFETEEEAITARRIIAEDSDILEKFNSGLRVRTTPLWEQK